MGGVIRQRGGVSILMVGVSILMGRVIRQRGGVSAWMGQGPELRV